jgi:hypothetical protein
MNARKNLSAILFVFVIGVQQLSGQGNDTSIFFRYAATFDNLIPSPYYPGQTYMADTASLELLNAAPLSMNLKKSVSREYISDNGQSMENLGAYGYTWDREGRLIAYSEFWPGDTAAHLHVRFRFLNRQNVADVIATSGSNVDTASFQYNRSGWVGTWRRHVMNVDTNYLINGTRMYDSRGQLIVATNVSYGPLQGSYTFEYDKDGRLIRRSFLSGGSGIVLCTDTLVYEYATEARLILTITHKLKVSGMEKWVSLERKTIFAQTRRVISYSDFNDADTNYFYRNLPSYTVSYEYDDKSRIASEIFGTDIMPDIITAKYYYSAQHQPDSVVYSERIADKKMSIPRVYSRDVRTYNQKGFITTRTVTTYFFEEKKKKDKLVPTEIIRISYQWR